MPEGGDVDSVSLRNLKHTLDNVLEGKSATVMVPASLEAGLTAMKPGYAVSRAADQPVPDAIALDGVFSWNEAHAAITDAFARAKAGGVVLIRLQLDPDIPVQREEIMVRFARTFTDFAVRILGLPRPGASISPWMAISQRLPRALLFATATRAGKTNTVMDLAIRSGIRAIHGDQVLEGLATGRLEGPEAIQAIARAAHSVPDWAQAIRDIFEQGQTGPFLDLVLEQAAGADFLFDMWVPLAGRSDVAAYFASHGYFVFQPDADATSVALAGQARLAEAVERVEAALEASKAADAARQAVQDAAEADRKAGALALEETRRAGEEATEAARRAGEEATELVRNTAEVQLAAAAQAADQLAAEKLRLRAKLHAIKRSRSWRLTAPLRALARFRPLV